MMGTEPIPGSGKKKRRRRRRRRSSGGATAPVTQQAKPNAPARPPAGQEIDYDRVAAECLKGRHAPIFDWMKAALGKDSKTLIREIVRSAVIKERVAFREAQGLVSSSSMDIEKLANR